MFSVCENKKKNISTERLIGDLHCLKLSCPQQLLNESVCRITLILPDIALCLVQKASLKTNEDMSKKQQYTGHSYYFCQRHSTFNYFELIGCLQVHFHSCLFDLVMHVSQMGITIGLVEKKQLLFIDIFTCLHLLAYFCGDCQKGNRINSNTGFPQMN